MLSKKLILKLVKLATMLGAATLASCGSGSCAPGTGAGSNGGTYNLVVDNTSPVPLINGTDKDFYVYMTNIGNGNVTDLSWSINEISASSSIIKSLWNNAKSSLGFASKDLAAADGIQILSFSECVNVNAGASCRMLLHADRPSNVSLQSKSPTSKNAITENILSSYIYAPPTTVAETGILTLSPITSVNYGNGFAGYTFFIINNSSNTINLDQAPFGILPAGIDYSIIAGQSCPNPVPALNSCQVRLTFRTSTVGNGNTITVPLTPTGSIVGGDILPTQATKNLTVSSEKLGNISATSTSMIVDANSTSIVSSYAVISNTGSGPLTLGNLSSGAPQVSISDDECSGKIIAAGSLCRYKLNIDSAQVTSASSSVTTIPYNDGKTSSSTSASVKWLYIATVTPAPAISLSSNNSNLTQSSLTTTVTLQNSGNVTLNNVSTLVLSPTNPRVTATNNNCEARLTIGASCTYTLTYAPAAPSETNVINLGGITASYVDTSGTVQSFTPSTTTSVNVSSTYQGFLATGGDFSLNSTIPTKTVTITNSGTYTATISNIDISGANLTTTGGSCDATGLNAGATCTIIVALSDSSTEASGNGNLTLTYDNHNGNPTAKALSNISWIVGNAPSLSVHFAQSNLIAAAGGESTTLVTLLNNGGTALNNIVLPTPPTNFTWVQRADSCALSGQNLATNESCTVTLRYAPTTTAAGATVVIGKFSATTGQNNPYNTSDYTVTATAISQVVLSFDQSPVIHATWVNPTVTSSVIITNTDSSPITINTITPSSLLSTSGCTGPISAGGNCTLTITGGPYSASGSGSISFTYTTLAGVKTQAINVTATYQAKPIITPKLLVSPSSIGTITVLNNGTPVTQDMSLTNITTMQNSMSAADGTLRIKQTSLYPASANGVSYSYSVANIPANACPAAVNGYISLPKATCNFKIIASGSSASTLNRLTATPINTIYQAVAYSDNSLTPTLTSDTAGPQVNATTTVTQAVAALSAPTLVNSGDSNAFNGVSQNTTAGPIIFTVRNIGNAAVIGAITAPTIAGFTFDMSTCTNLAVNTDCTFKATLNSSTTIAQASLKAYNLTYNTSLMVPLPDMLYSVIAPGAPNIVLLSTVVSNCQQWSGSPNASTCLINTGNNAPGVIITLKNTGTSATSNFNITNLTAFQAVLGSGYQALVNTCNGTLAGASTCKITISPSSPTASASYTAYDIASTALSYSYSGGSGSTTPIAVDVTVADPILTISSIANIPATGDSPATVTLSNWYSTSLPASPSFNILPSGRNIATTACTWAAAPPTGATCDTTLSTAGTTTAGTYTIKASITAATSSAQTFTVDPAPCQTNCIFVTTQKYSGNLLSAATAAGGGSPVDGFAAADYLCNLPDANKPNNDTYKALLMRNEATTSGQSYYRASDIEFIAVASDGNLASSLTKSINTTSGQAWTGGYDLGSSDYPNCNDWTDDANSSTGGFGSINATNNTWFAQNHNACNTSASLYCVQQPPGITVTAVDPEFTAPDCTVVTATLPSPATSSTAVTFTISPFDNSNTQGFAASASANSGDYTETTSCTIASGQSSCSTTSGSNNFCASGNNTFEAMIKGEATNYQLGKITVHPISE